VIPKETPTTINATAMRTLSGSQFVQEGKMFAMSEEIVGVQVFNLS
jgi:hypothetical protein